MSQHAHAYASLIPRPPGLRLRASSDTTTYVVSLIGDVDIAVQAALSTEIDRALRSGCREVVVDLGACEFLDSTGVHALMTLQRRLAGMPGRELLILPGPRHVQRVFQVSGVLNLLPFAP